MGTYNRLRGKIRKDFRKLIREFEGLFYYGCDVDKWIIEIMLLPYISLQWRLDRTWYRLIAPPGSGKSKHLNLLSDFELSYVIDEFTPKSFISGFRTSGGEDPSKLPQFDGKVVIISDESTLMEQRQEDRNIVQSILRKAYDGKMGKAFGNIKEKQEYEAHFNMLVGSTPQIDRYFIYNQALGERYMNYRVQIPNRRMLAEKAFENQFRDFDARYEKLKLKIHKFLRRLPDVDIRELVLPDDAKRLLIDCADFITLIRTRITRDSTGRHVTTLPQAESAGRLVQQMTQTAISNAILKGSGTVRREHIDKAIYLGLGSVTAITIFILHHVLEHTAISGVDSEASWFSVQFMCIRTALGRGTVARTLEDLAIHKVLKIRKGRKQGGRLFEYSIDKNAFTTMDYVGLFRNYVPPCKEILQLKRLDRFRPTGTKKKKKRKTKKIENKI